MKNRGVNNSGVKRGVRMEEGRWNWRGIGEVFEFCLDKRAGEGWGGEEHLD